METEQIKTVALIVMALALGVVAALELCERLRWARLKRKVAEARERLANEPGGNPCHRWASPNPTCWAIRFLQTVIDNPGDIRALLEVEGWFQEAITAGRNEGFKQGHAEGLADAAKPKPPGAKEIAAATWQAEPAAPEPRFTPQMVAAILQNPRRRPFEGTVAERYQEALNGTLVNHATGQPADPDEILHYYAGGTFDPVTLKPIWPTPEPPREFEPRQRVRIKEADWGDPFHGRTGTILHKAALGDQWYIQLDSGTRIVRSPDNFEAIPTPEPTPTA